MMIEDGSGMTNADSYIGVEEVRDHFRLAGDFVLSDLSDQQVERLCVKATRYLDSTYGDRLQGHRTSADQSLAWPRMGVTVHGGTTLLGEATIPLGLKRAAYAAARQAHEGDLRPTARTTAPVVQESVTVGEISESRTYAYPHDAAETAYPEIDAHMQPFLRSAGLTARMVR